MSYHYEQLGDQRFQQLCQALLLESFPHAQCLPIGQADGGRDAVQTTKSKPIIVFQVKFYAKANAEKYPHLWLRRKLEEEREFIQRLVRKGMERYILLTNVPGRPFLIKGQ